MVGRLGQRGASGPSHGVVANGSPSLARRLGLGDAVVIGLGSMIGAGVFSAFAPAARAAGTGLLIGLVIAAFVAFCNAVASAQLAAVHPTSGGTYIYGRERLGPWWGFAAGWAFVVGKTASCAAMALTFAAYAVPESAWVQRPVALVAVVALGALNYRGITRTAALTRILVTVVLICLAVTVVTVLAGGHLHPDRIGGWSDLTSSGWYGILQSGGLLFFAFAGYARIATLGEEVRDPARTIPRAIPIALAITVAVYTVVAVTILLAAGPGELAITGAPVKAAAEQAGAGGLAPVVQVGAALASLGALLALITGVGRTTLAMARHHDLPGWLEAVHPRHHVPHHAEIAVATVVGVLVLTTDLRGVIAFSSFGVLLYYGIANAAAYTQPAAQRRWPKALQVLGVAGCVLLAATLPWTSLVAGVAVLIVGIGARAIATPSISRATDAPGGSMVEGMSNDFLDRAGLHVDPALATFIEDEAAPAVGVDAGVYWDTLARVVTSFTPRNRALLEERTRIQDAIDAWHRDRAGKAIDAGEYRTFLTDLGYLVPEGEPFTIDTSGVDPEIATVAGPQLVVPSTNARYALNAANARWGSLYDALYGTDAMGSTPPDGPYDETRGAEVVAWARAFLDRAVPLAEGSHADVVRYTVAEGRLAAELDGGSHTELRDPDALTGYRGEPDEPDAILLTHHGLGIEIVVDPSTQVGGKDRAGVSDVLLESAVTTIVDFEDSVAAVDGTDKATCYRVWLGLLTGELTEKVSKGDETFTRRLAEPKRFTGSDGDEVESRPHSLLLARNVGHLMTTPAVRDADGSDIPEGLLDAVTTVYLALADVGPDGRRTNSPAGSVYVVKPKMHGPDEVAFAVDVLAAVEEAFGLPANTVKIGIMDEERRTSVNLAECIRAARSRVAFINTGFLDRTGDEIHTSMLAGPMVRKADMKSQPWITTYEDRNVDVGLACGLKGRAQIGKGMWAAPERMAAMLEEKIGHPKAGASTAWVPSPTAATLHATHYHEVDVAERQDEIAAGGARTDLADLLVVPTAEANWSEDERKAEVENNAQGILGYVVRWVDQGVGCSKVPDIHGIALMEDRATCRISSQHIANWLEHDVVTFDQVEDALRRMAATVDEQNAGDPGYTDMAPAFDDEAFRAARDLVLEGTRQPAGYTEPLLHAHRLSKKAGS